MPFSSPASDAAPAVGAALAGSSKIIFIISSIVIIGTALFVVALGIGLGVGFGVGGRIKIPTTALLSAPVVSCSISQACGCQTDKPSFTPRIINGQPASVNSWPWMVYLVMNNVKVCSGFIISPHHILTAASCIAAYGYNISVTLGTNNYQFTWGGVNVTNATALQTISLGDIAVVTLGANITYSSTIQPCCISSNLGIPTTGVNGVIAGWGETSSSSLGTVSPVLEQAVVQVINQTSCGNTGNDTLCAGYDSISACPIDAGGPLMISYNNAWTCVGIITGRVSGCTNPITFTRIASYAALIFNVTSIPIPY
jgi:secreted trypsin-like serine protease